MVFVIQLSLERLRISTDLQNEIKYLFKNMLGLKKRGTNLFFTDIDQLKNKMLEELKDS